MNTYGVEKGTTIRQPSTANLMIDSADRNITTYPSAASFQITKPNALANGFFSRIGTTEVVLEWCSGNIDGTITLDISGATVRSTESALYVGGIFMTMADLLNNICLDLSGTNGVGLSISTSVNPGFVSLVATNGKIRVITTPLAVAAGFDTDGALGGFKSVLGCPDLRLYRYLDFVSPQLTYAQDLKDTSTAPIIRDVLCRWYMAEDQQEARDQYGFPILMGYEPFIRRRIFNPPKQIKWDSNLPIGNLQFEVYADDGQLATLDSSQFLMTLQLSEN